MALQVILIEDSFNILSELHSLFTLSDTLSDVNECIDPSSCGSNSLCINLNGTFECQCDSLYQMVGDKCESK